MNKDNSMVLDDKARTATKASLDDKWRGIKGGTVVDQGQANCALCKEYRVSYRVSTGFMEPLNCTGCPIHAKTGKHGCEDTPFHKWHKHQSAEHKMCKERIIHCSICAEIVDEGIAFLEGLLKVEEQKPDDIVLSFENQAEYEAFYSILTTTVGVPDAVSRFRCTDKDVLENWMRRAREGIDDKAKKGTK